MLTSRSIMRFIWIVYVFSLLKIFLILNTYLVVCVFLEIWAIARTFSLKHSQFALKWNEVASIGFGFELQKNVYLVNNECSFLGFCKKLLQEQVSVEELKLQMKLVCLKCKNKTNVYFNMIRRTYTTDFT